MAAIDTTHPTETPVLRPAFPPEPVYRFTVEQYHEMARHGILTSDDKVELLDGFVVPRMTVHPPHSASMRLLRRELTALNLTGWFFDVQQPITTDESEPEPDVALIRGVEEDYNRKHPTPRDVGLVIEVSDDSLRKDHTVKKRAYARARIPVYWIVNLIDYCVEVYTQPSGPSDTPDYADRIVLSRGDELVVMLDDEEYGRIAVASILP